MVDIIMYLAMEGSAVYGTDRIISYLGKSNQSRTFLNSVNLVTVAIIHKNERHKNEDLSYFSLEIQD